MTNAYSKVTLRTTIQSPSPLLQPHLLIGHPTAANYTNRPNKNHPLISPISTCPATYDRQPTRNHNTKLQKCNTHTPVTIAPNPKSHHDPNNDRICNTSHPVFSPSPKICPPRCHPSPPRTKPTKPPQQADVAKLQVGPVKTDQPAASANHQLSTSDKATFPHLKHNIPTIFEHDLSYNLNETKRLLEDMRHKLDKYLPHPLNTRTIHNDTPSPAPSIDQPHHESNPTLFVQQPTPPQNLYDLISTIPLAPSWHLQEIPAINQTERQIYHHLITTHTTDPTIVYLVALLSMNHHTANFPNLPHSTASTTNQCPHTSLRSYLKNTYPHSKDLLKPA